MSSTTDFEEWLSNYEPEGHEEIFCLWKAVLDGESYGLYDVVEDNGKIFVKSGDGDTLAITSDKMKKAFLHRIEKFKNDPEMDMESWYHFERNMANPNA